MDRNQPQSFSTDTMLLLAPKQCDNTERELLTSSLDRPNAMHHMTVVRQRSCDRPQSETIGSGSCPSKATSTNHLTVECLVSVRAQVMVWDEVYCGWLPVDGGGVCGISLLQQVTCHQMLLPSSVQPNKRSSWSGGGNNIQSAALQPSETTSPHWEYRIQGKRISDQKVLLNCILMARACYRAALPTFHHWRVEQMKYGLSFGSSYDAAKFHNRLQKALEHLARQSKSSSGESNLDANEELEDDVFAPIDLPIVSEVHESSSIDNNNDDQPPMDPVMPSHMSRVVQPEYNNNNNVPSSVSQRCTFVVAPAATSLLIDYDQQKLTGGGSSSASSSTVNNTISSSMRFNFQSNARTGPDSITYLNEQFLRKHSSPLSANVNNRLHTHAHHNYSPMERYVSGPSYVGSKKNRRGSVGQLKYATAVNRDMILLPLKKPSMAGEIIRRERCYYCGVWYSMKENASGACKDAPDPIETWIRRLSCYRCAQCTVFYCMRDDDGEVDRDDVCSCSAPTRRVFRWTILGIIACFVPCLCCYWPMRIVRCCCCGRTQRGRHKPSPINMQQSAGSIIGAGRNSRSTTSRTTSRLSSF